MCNNNIKNQFSQYSINYAFSFVDQSICYLNLCENGGTCKDTENGSICICDPPFYGRKCQCNTFFLVYNYRLILFILLKTAPNKKIQ